MLAARLREAAEQVRVPAGALGARTLITVALSLVVVTTPLGLGSWHVLQEQRILSRAQPVAERWATEQGWHLTDVHVRRGTLFVEAIGRPPEASEVVLRDDLSAAGLDDVEAVVTLLVGGSRPI